MKYYSIIIICVITTFIFTCCSNRPNPTYTPLYNALSTMDAKQAIAVANKLRDSMPEITSHVTPREVIFDFPDERQKIITLPDSAMYIAVAPYINTTHECSQHYPSSCTGELFEKTVKLSATDSLTNLFAGDPNATAESWRKFFGQLAGMLQAKASAFVLDLILSPGTTEYLAALPFPANVIAIPVITGVVNAAVKAITDPIISSILSFSSGGRVDQPTMAIIGDGSRLGSRNREWIFNDSQLKATVQMASTGSNAALIAKLDRVEKLLASQELTTTLKG